MELKPNMYVRTKGGYIEKIISFKSTISNDYVELEDKFYANKKDILKASHNIIDLIEVDDYVNGSKVNIIENEFIYFDTGHSIHYKYIETIVTKEQMEAIQYKVV